MLTQVKMADAVGKTIERVVNDLETGQLRLFFTDGTFVWAHATASLHWDTEISDFEFEPEIKKSPKHFRRLLVANGICTAEEAGLA